MDRMQIRALAVTAMLISLACGVTLGSSGSAMAVRRQAVIQGASHFSLDACGDISQILSEGKLDKATKDKIKKIFEDGVPLKCVVELKKKWGSRIIDLMK
ncbi:hypothetical protein SSP35_43_00110 [Streptomyces sp. NBRC 110611]|uniref:hypothetical protein n=1 Tax=Streptomyces sp. NBRC 110611 TaxID=1621259 RepID=UPI000858D47B|nr:hypothetical protein [Streptomyces sp. NBRC 110611]GAU71507.1 hypothetical protein SSP35_43_00110 [Streptomyces sp. NBRC 110611]